MSHTPNCPNCDGRTVEFRGSGDDAQFRICSRWREPGHLSREEIEERIAVECMTQRPSGRLS